MDIRQNRTVRCFLYGGNDVTSEAATSPRSIIKEREA